MKRFWAAIAVVAVITAVRISLIEALHDQAYYAKYTIFAGRILAGAIPRDRLLDLSPLYLWFTVAMRAIGASFNVIRGLQIVLVSVAALLAGYAARRWGTVASVTATAFILLSRGAFVCATELEPCTLVLLLNSAALAALMNASPLTGGLLLGLSATCGPGGLLIAIFVAMVMRSWRVVAAAIVPVASMLILNFALTGEVALMNPGIAFYEGMNPNATGYGGVPPHVVNDLERSANEPAYRDVAYRVVASGAAGHPVSRREANVYWASKAVAFAQTYPLTAWRLAGRKLVDALQSYEAYDFVTMVRKDFDLSILPIFLPFALLVGLSTAAIRRGLGAAPVWAFAIAAMLPMIIFTATATARNAMLPAAAVLAALGVAEIVRRNKVLPALAAVAIAILLSVNGNAQREDLAGWIGWRNVFDEAIALENVGRWSEAEVMLEDLRGYHPLRQTRAVSSVAFYRARAAMHLQKPKAVVMHLLDQAERDAPGNEYVLALRAVLGDHRSEEKLNRLHDPFTARRAMSAARL